MIEMRVPVDTAQPRHQPWRVIEQPPKRLMVCLVLLLVVDRFPVASGLEPPAGAAWAAEEPASAVQDEQLPLLTPDSPEYRTPRAGEGFRTTLFGHQTTVRPSDRRSVSAWDFGVDVNLPPPDNRGVLPIGAVYLWRHRNDGTLFRADLAGVYDDVFFARAFSEPGSFEWVLTFRNYTLPFAQSELVDGEAVKTQELLWGEVRPGFGVGYRRQVSPGHQDNMLAMNLTLEPGYLFFAKGARTAADFVVPQDTVEIREHLQLRWDAFERNILSLPHEGFAAGADLVHGHRIDWKNWGVNGSQSAGAGRDYLSFTGYVAAAGAVPGLQSDRHRLIGAVHGGFGYNLDRFSAPRVGGGVRAIGEEYGSTWRPILPGSMIGEFYPTHYLLAVGEYRREVLFSTYLSLTGSVGWLAPLTQTGNQTFRKDQVFSSLGERVSTGFFFRTIMHLAYNYNFGVIRDGHHGGHEIVLHFSRNF